MGKSLGYLEPTQTPEKDIRFFLRDVSIIYERFTIRLQMRKIGSTLCLFIAS